MNKDFEELARNLACLYEESYKTYKQEVNYIINYHIKDINYIERTLDYIMDIYTDKGFILFLKLCTYYSTINYQGANAYLDILKEQRKEEYEDFVKKYSKKYWFFNYYLLSL